MSVITALSHNGGSVALFDDEDKREIRKKKKIDKYVGGFCNMLKRRKY